MKNSDIDSDVRKGATAPDEATLERFDALRRLLAPLGRVAVALSGGVDSSFLCATCATVPGLRVAAFTTDPDLMPTGDVERASALARNLGIHHEVIDTMPFADPVFVSNPIDRCFFCRERAFKAIIERAAELGFDRVVDGTVVDDTLDYRPGRLAARRLGVMSPLLDSGLTKSDLRALSGMVPWIAEPDRPSGPCLASRFRPGSPITARGISQVRQVEDAAAAAGIRNVRARHFDDLVKIEVGLEDMATVVGAVREALVMAARTAGFNTVAIDLEPYRTGRMNELIGEK